VTVTEAEAHEAGTCSNDECPYAETGECALGKSPLDCDYFHLDEPDEEGASLAVDVDEVRLPSADALTSVTLYRVLMRRQASIVVPLGHVEAGKTTLIAVIFEHLAAGRLGGWSLAGSCTVIGFGRRSHLAMTRSGRSTADTDHTSVDSSEEYLHIDARSTETDSIVSVVFADISGENVRQQVIGPNDPVVEAAIGIADHIPVFVDGALVGEPKRLQDAIRQAQDILWTIDAVARRPEAQVCLVITKADLAPSVDLDEVARAVRIGGPPWAADLPAFATAARSVGDLPPGSGASAFFGHVARRREVAMVATWLPLEVPDASPLVADFWSAP
jgi:Double-GTPase 2